MTRHFESFNESMTSYYGTDFACMRQEFLEEQRKCARETKHS